MAAARLCEVAHIAQVTSERHEAVGGGKCFGMLWGIPGKRACCGLKGWDDVEKVCKPRYLNNLIAQRRYIRTTSALSSDSESKRSIYSIKAEPGIVAAWIFSFHEILNPIPCIHTFSRYATVVKICDQLGMAVWKQPEYL